MARYLFGAEGQMLIIPAVLLALLFALFIAASLPVKGRSAFLLALYLLGCSAVLFPFEIAGLWGCLNRPTVFLGLQALLASGGALLWWSRRRPSLAGPFETDLRNLDFKRVISLVRRHPALSLFALVVDTAYALNAYLILVVPPNNNDSSYLHMPRVAHWLQAGTFLSYPTSIPIQLFYPINAQGLMFWTVLFWGSDQLVGYVQFSAALILMLSIFTLARLLDYSRAQAAFATLLFATFPQVFQQSTTTQNDLVPISFYLAGLVFLLRGLQGSRQRTDLFLPALGFALAVDTKQTAFFLIPGTVILTAVFVLRYRAEVLPFIYRLAPLSVFAFILAGGVIYIHNVFLYHNPLGDPAYIQTESGVYNGTPLIRGLWLNINRTAYQFIDTTGLPPIIEGYLFRGKARLAKAVYGWLKMPLEDLIGQNPKSEAHFSYYARPLIQEDETWFGIFFPVLVIPAALIRLVRSNIHKDALPAGLWAVAASYAIIELLLRPGWDRYIGRHFIDSVVLLTPFAAGVYRPGKVQRIVCLAVIAVSLYMLVNVALYNESKPLIGRNAIWNLSRIDKLTLENHEYNEPAHMVDQWVPESSTLGIPAGTWEYYFFGPHLERKLVTVSDVAEYANPAWLRRHGIVFLLIQNYNLTSGFRPAGVRIVSGKEWSLFRLP
jgi:hypothetical protein